jgi:hypothetical protein
MQVNMDVWKRTDSLIRERRKKMGCQAENWRTAEAALGRKISGNFN